MDDLISRQFALASASSGMIRTENGKLEYYIPKDDGIDDETARRITEEANKACAKCKDLNCWECEYRRWRSKSFVITKNGIMPEG